ncbi:uncharacterized protein LOC111070560 [Drosophila obscura]|uniref:uncharacterized protein LOC111070560 n=1 Tax=Drosophila obscura TaxID=7282 RepID=UPI001BB1A45E|nr:uncharacterized protein LOC111070560 [Drosophila obscura]
MLLCSASLCCAQNVTHLDDSQEALKVEALLQASSSTSTTAQPPSSSTAPLTKAKAKQAHEIEEDDNNFSNDRLPQLTDDEYSSLGEDANPLHFLKQQPPQQQQQPKPEPVVMAPQSSASSIYITIPIYINTAGKVPLTLTIGDQQMSLNPQRKAAPVAAANKKSPHTKAPNSHFNRLLQQIETSPKRRTTNRHRSQLKSNIYAAKERPDRHASIY